MISIVILTYNSEKSISRTLLSIAAITDDIHVVDSFSDDHTIEICRGFNCSINQRGFDNYAEQRNWAISSLELKYPWQFHIDSDEELEPELVHKIKCLDLSSTDFDGYLVGRKTVVLGRVLRFGGIAKTWHCRLFRSGKGRCEDRLYDQHFICDGRVGLIKAFMRDHQEASLSEWTARHNRWSDLEAREVMKQAMSHDEGEIQARLDGNPIERRRFYKTLYYKNPIFMRAVVFFIYRYVIQLGFLDGYPGLIYHVLQGLWFRFLIDAKIYECRLQSSNVAPKSNASLVDPSSDAATPREG